MIVAAHQPGLLPGLSVVSKIAAADLYIACDCFQAVRHQWLARNRLADGTPLTVPLDHTTWDGPIRDARIGQDARWRHKLTKTLELKIGEPAQPYISIIRRPYQRLVALNAALLHQLLLDLGIDVEWAWQSHLESGQGNPIRAHSDDDSDIAPRSERLAAICAEVGGTTWLSGPSGKGYLDEQPFHELGIQVRYHDWDGPNPSAITALADAGIRWDLTNPPVAA